MSFKNSSISFKEEYESFRASVPLKKVSLRDDSTQIWSFYESGPKSVRCPLVFLPPVSGGADVYFRQILALSGRGYRVISVDYPCYWNIETFCAEFKKFLTSERFDKVHLFGASLGGYLAQRFAESCYGFQRVASLMLCNSFTDTAIFDRQQTALMYWALPAVFLKRIILGGFPNVVDKEIVASVDFMIDRLESLTQEQLASRMTLNCAKSKCQTSKVSNLPITIMDVFDDSALSSGAKDQMIRLYPDARRAHFKSGGNFPYLSRSAEVNLHIQVNNNFSPFNGKSSRKFFPESFISVISTIFKIHLQKFKQTVWAACESDE